MQACSGCNSLLYKTVTTHSCAVRSSAARDKAPGFGASMGKAYAGWHLASRAMRTQLKGRQSPPAAPMRVPAQTAPAGLALGHPLVCRIRPTPRHQTHSRWHLPPREAGGARAARWPSPVPCCHPLSHTRTRSRGARLSRHLRSATRAVRLRRASTPGRSPHTGHPGPNKAAAGALTCDCVCKHDLELMAGSAGAAPP